MGEDILATILLVVIYLVFIGLGLPDSIFGTAWPAIYPEFNVPVSYANFVTVIISCGTVISSLASARVIHRFGTAVVTMVSTAMTAVALLGFSLSGSMGWLCLFALPLGLGAGAIDAALNNYIALHYKAAHMNFIACFYGIGITASPFLMSLILGEQNNWRGGYRAVFFIQLAVTLLTILSLPLWGKRRQSAVQEEDASSHSVPLRKLLRMPSLCFACLTFVGSCAIEFTCNTWGSTFLVQAKGMSVDHAAQLITFYYVGMTLGRFLAGVLSTKVTGWRMIRIGQAIILAAIVILLLPLPMAFSAAALFLIGLGNGPLFPNLAYLTPQNFGTELSQSAMGVQMAAANLGILFMPPLFGFLAQLFGLSLFPIYLLGLFLLMACSTTCLIRRLKKEGRYKI